MCDTNCRTHTRALPSRIRYTYSHIYVHPDELLFNETTKTTTVDNNYNNGDDDFNYTIFLEKRKWCIAQLSSDQINCGIVTLMRLFNIILDEKRNIKYSCVFALAKEEKRWEATTTCVLKTTSANTYKLSSAGSGKSIEWCATVESFWFDAKCYGMKKLRWIYALTSGRSSSS